MADQTPVPVPTQTVGLALLEILKSAASVITATAVIGGFLYVVAGPFVVAKADDYIAAKTQGQFDAMNARIEGLNSRFDQVLEAVRDVEAGMNSLPREEYIDAKGGGVVVDPFRVYRPGETVQITYTLRRTLPCATIVQVRFLRDGAIDTSLSYERPSTRVAIGLEHQPFTVSVTLPEDMPPGNYAYAPLLIPDRTECPREPLVVFPTSGYFRVGAAS